MVWGDEEKENEDKGKEIKLRLEENINFIIHIYCMSVLFQGLGELWIEKTQFLKEGAMLLSLSQQFYLLIPTPIPLSFSYPKRIKTNKGERKKTKQGQWGILHKIFLPAVMS